MVRRCRSKFYFFDLGVTNSLLGRCSLAPGTDEYGRCFEHFIGLELRAFLSYRRKDAALTFWRSQSGLEVDFVVGKELAIAVKSTDLVQERDLKGLRALREEGLIRKCLVVSRDTERRVLDGIEIYPWAEFLDSLWAGQLSVGD